MSKILKNTTGSAISISDTGISVPASPGQYTIPAADYSLWADSSDVYLPLASGDLLFNDGSNDYDGTNGFQLSVAIDILKDSQAKSVNTSTEGLVDAFDNGDGKIRLAIDVGAAGVQIPGPQGDQGVDGESIETLDEGSSLTLTTKKLNFVGAGVTATEPIADEVTVTIPGGGGDFSDGGDTASATRVLGNNNAFDLDFETNGSTRMKITDDGCIQTSASKESGFVFDIQNTNVDGHGLRVKAGEVLGDIILSLEDSDGTYIIMEVEADQGHTTFGKSYAQTLADNGVVYGIDNQMDGVTSDFNCESGAYRIGGSLPYNEVSATALTNTTSTSYVVVSGMTITPGAGTYIATFSASGRGQQDNQQMQVALFDNGTKVGHTERDYGYEADNQNEDKRFGIHTQALITVAAGQAIDVRFLTNTSAFNIFERSLILQKVKAD